MKPNILVGGQAVIEGVMMRVPGAYSTAVRDPDGNIKIKRNMPPKGTYGTPLSIHRLTMYI